MSNKNQNIDGIEKLTNNQLANLNGGGFLSCYRDGKRMNRLFGIENTAQQKEIIWEACKAEQQ